MTGDVTDILLRDMASNKPLRSKIQGEWGGSDGTNALKLWLIRTLSQRGRFFCCHFMRNKPWVEKEKDGLKKNGLLVEREYLLDLIAFDREDFLPSIGAEIEWNYSKKENRGERYRLLVKSGVKKKDLREQKDAEFYYDFSRILAVGPTRGIFIGGSYYDKEAVERWQRGFERLLAAQSGTRMKEMCIFLILKVRRIERHHVLCFQWKPRHKNVLKLKKEDVIP